MVEMSIHGLFVFWFGVMCSRVCIKGQAIGSEMLNITSNGTIYKETGTPWLPSRVADGTVGDPDTCGCCATVNRPSWIQVDLGQPHLLTRLELFGRTDLGDTPDKTDSKQFAHIGLVILDGVRVVNYTQTSTNITTMTYILAPEDKVQYIRLHGRYEYNKYMTVCEIKAYSRKECSNTECPRCSRNCVDNESCNVVHGDCIHGCKDGYNYTGDKTCKTECVNGTYGSNCNATCSSYCAADEVCNKVTGICKSGCLPGFDFTNDTTCKTECRNGTYGMNCSHSCSPNCYGNDVCSKNNGTCRRRCLPGYAFTMDNTCNTPCPNGTYGVDCLRNCSGNCAHGDTCVQVNGSCTRGCLPGFDYPNNSTCSKHLNLIQRIKANIHTMQSSTLSNCTADKAVDNMVGVKDVCEACSVTSGNDEPWWELDLGTQYLVDYVVIYGPDSVLEGGVFVSNTKVNFTKSDLHNSVLNISRLSLNGAYARFYTSTLLRYINIHGFKKSNLTVCEVKIYEAVCSKGHFGQDCQLECHCRGDEPCDAVSGSCKMPGCKPGWHEEACSKACSHGTFGMDCNDRCHCYNDGDCDRFNGTCTNGRCAEGYSSHSCNATNKELPYQEVKGGANAGAIAGGIIAALLLVVGFCVGIFIFRRKQRGRLPSIKTEYVKSTDNKPRHVIQTTDVFAGNESCYYNTCPVTSGIRIHEIWVYIREKKHQLSYFDDEFSRLQNGLVHKHDVASLPENKVKNRYRELYAYDHSRVSLKKDKPGDSEYINASFIHGYTKLNKFIASQGPTEKIMNDFWRMIWQQRVEKIVMLTNTVELGTLKCLQYWPGDSNSISEFEGIMVKYSTAEETLDYNIRTFEVKVNSESRVVKQFHFTSWPDKNVPDTAWCLVEFWRVVDTTDEVNQSPILVHCSAGIGRTGTFIALDNLIYQARKEKAVRPLAIVQTLRDQRVNMVQTKDQYVYLHEALAEALLMGTHHVLTRQFESIYTYMIGKEMGSEATRIEEQYDLIEKSIKESTECDDLEIVPATANNDPLDSGSEYGNLTTISKDTVEFKKKSSTFSKELGTLSLPTFDSNNSILACQSPTKDRLTSFWSVVDEHLVSTIISLTSTLDAAYNTCQYLGASAGIVVGSKTIQFEQEKTENAITTRIYTISARDTKEHSTKTVKQFQMSSWKDKHDTPSDTGPILDLIAEVYKWQPNLAANHPILIHCGTGYTRCGIVTVLFNELRRILTNHGQINIVETVKTLKQNNRKLITNMAQYRFCYDAIRAYVNDANVYMNV